MKSNQIKQAFESVQADSDLADRVLYAAAGEPLHRKGHAKPLYVAVIGCLAGVLATGGSPTLLSIPVILPLPGKPWQRRVRYLDKWRLVGDEIYLHQRVW